MNESFLSMYNDRLIPATDLFYVAENSYIKKAFIDAALFGSEESFNPTAFKRRVDELNRSTDLLLAKYEKTFLVKQEKDQLDALKKGMAISREIEKKIVLVATEQGVEAARELYHNEGHKASTKNIKRLSALMSIQKQIGEELIKDSASMISGSKLYSGLQVALAILIGILIVGIIFTSNVVKMNNDKFNLN